MTSTKQTHEAPNPFIIIIAALVLSAIVIAWILIGSIGLVYVLKYKKSSN